MKASKSNFWTDLESKKISKEQVSDYLFSKLGIPTNQTQSNLLQEIIKRINAYYFTEEPINNTVYSLTGSVKSVKDIIEKRFKEGKKKGQTYYVLKISTESETESIQARQEDLATTHWNQITKSALIGKNLVFKYKIWITNKILLDFYPLKNNEKNKQKLKRSHKALRGGE
ncbi:MAG: hypothetical protein mread185_000259 [Mycoplasmataceae bacterium]|nr:MAG: hypothetical protein mread185_000259 [Mycoplasmataceae bacterium]